MIITIDVGIKNLALCAMDASVPKDIKTFKIMHWEVYNLLDDEAGSSKCCGTKKNGQTCGKKASVIVNSSGGTECLPRLFCKTHVPKGVSVKAIKEKKVKDYTLQELAKIVIGETNQILGRNKELFEKASGVYVELQPKVNNKMKLISHILYGKLVEFYMGSKTIIRFVRASQKLKAYTGPVVECNLKGMYAKRKFLSVQYTWWFLKNVIGDSTEWAQKFESHTKKDDLGDVFLMGINALKGVKR